MEIRFATPADAAGILAVYAQYIDTPVTFETELPSLASFSARVAAIAARYPYLVCLDGEGRVRGYAYAHAQHERAAYQWNAELSIYLDRAWRGHGIGSRLYPVLFDILRLQGARTLYALVTVPNAASERLHARFGFTAMGVQRGAGFKAGRWHDVAWFVKRVAPLDESPLPLLPVGAVARAAIEKALARFQG